MRRTEELVRRRCVEEEFSFCAPMMAGAVHGCLLATFFQPGEGVELRLAFNSRGGGPATPAWGYQALIPQPVVGQRYSLASRTASSRLVSRGLDEAAAMCRDWLGVVAAGCV